MSKEIEVPIDGHHDYFKITTGDEDEVEIELWSRGTFTVNMALSPEDAKAFGEALIEAARDAQQVPDRILGVDLV